MKKSVKILLAILLVLVVVVAVLAVKHINSRETVPEGALAVHVGEKITYVDLSKQSLEAVQGSVVNGKGEVKAVDAQGLSLSRVLELAKVNPAEVSSVTVRSDDEYTAEISGGEVLESGKVYVTLDAAGGMRLVVFGDENSKRQVRDVVALAVELG